MSHYEKNGRKKRRTAGTGCSKSEWDVVKLSQKVAKFSEEANSTTLKVEERGGMEKKKKKKKTVEGPAHTYTGW